MGDQMDEVLHHTRYGMLDKGPVDFTVMMDEVPMMNLSEDELIAAKAKALLMLHFFLSFWTGRCGSGWTDTCNPLVCRRWDILLAHSGH